MKTPLMMIINPAAGKGKYKKGLAEALKRLSDADFEVSLYFTEYPGHATELAAEHGGEFPKLICLGGDGTLSEVIAGLMRLETRPQVGYIPIGTANDIARTLKLPKNEIEWCAQRYINGEAMPFDTGRIDDGYFNYVAAFGAFTEVSYATPQKAKRKFGEAAYLVAAAGSIGKLKSRHVRIEYDDGVLEGDFLYGGLSNSYSIGGVVDLPKDIVGLGDGLHELILVKKLPRVLSVVPLAARVLRHDLSSEYIVIKQTKKAKFFFDEPTPWSFDGEFGGETTEVEFENVHHAVEIVK